MHKELNLGGVTITLDVVRNERRVDVTKLGKGEFYITENGLSKRLPLPKGTYYLDEFCELREKMLKEREISMGTNIGDIANQAHADIQQKQNTDQGYEGNNQQYQG